MPNDNEQKEEAIEEKKEEEKELTPDEIFEQSFGELTDDTEGKTEETKESDKEETTTEEETISTEEGTIEDESKAEDKPEEKTQQEAVHKEEPPAKAPVKEKAKEEQQEERQEEKTEKTVDFDAGVLFEGLENDVTEKDLVEFAGEMDTNAKYAQEIAKMVGKRIINYTNQSFATLIDKLKPYLEATVKQIEKEHVSSVRERHPDFNSLKENEDVEVWIKEQPKYLQKAMMETFKKGESADVVDLLDSYKKDRGLVKPAKEEEEDPAKANNKKKIRDKIDNLSVVKTKASPVHLAQKANNQDDFEGAFDEIASSKR
jgi:hypothetical protein